MHVENKLKRNRMKNLIKIFLAVFLFVTAACDDTNKVNYTPPMTITFENVDESNIVVVEKGVTSYTAKIKIESSTKIRSLALYEADVKTGAKGNMIGKDTLFNPSLDTYSFEYEFTGLTTNKAVLIEVEDDNLMSFSKKILVKITRDVFESGIVIVESSDAFYGSYYGSWLDGRAYISKEAPKYVNEIDFSFGNIVITGTDTVAALVSPDKRKELGLPFIPDLKSCKFELTALTKANFDAIPAVDGSAIRALPEPTQSVLKVEAGKVYTYENDAEKGVVFIGVLQNKRASLQQQDGSWINNQAYHQLRIITKHVIKE
ncbi:MAG: hypothetical protein BWY08_00347 [Bacteroidetes bacterium ADurb.Bin174]|nr:MAG: hypothetical protein BWY08_00347 [Bacteroidetes bacterium ADurb.Bin174]